MQDTDNQDKTQVQDPLSLDIDDDKFAQILDDRITASETHFNTKKNLKERVERNEKYYFGKQIDPDQLKAYEGKWLDNIIWESEKSIKAMALSKLPDLIVKPGNDGDQSKQVAE